MLTTRDLFARMGPPQGRRKEEEEDGYPNSPNPETEGNGFFGWLKDGIDSGAAGTASGQMRFLQANTGFGGDTADYLDKIVNSNRRNKEYSAWDRIPGMSDYYTNGQGFAYDVGNALGSMGVLGAETAAAAALLPSGAYAGAAGAVGKIAPKLAQTMNTPLGKLGVANVAKTVFEAPAEGGSTGAQARAEGKSEDEVRRITNEGTLKNMGFLALSNTAESLGGNLVAKGIQGVGKAAVKESAKRILGGGAAGALQNGLEERTQTAISNDLLGKPSGHFYNPGSWTPDEWDSFSVGAPIGAIVGSAGGAASSRHTGGEMATEQPASQGSAFTETKGYRDSVTGMQYDLGGDGQNGMDCGLLTQNILNRMGYEVGDRSADGQLHWAEENGTYVSNDGKYKPKPGDLVFITGTTDRWTPTDSWEQMQSNPGAYAYKGVTHVGVVDEEGNIFQAGSSGVKSVPFSAFEGKIKGFARTGDSAGVNIGSAVTGSVDDSGARAYLENLVNTDSPYIDDAFAALDGQADVFETAEKLGFKPEESAKPEAKPQEQSAAAEEKLYDSDLLDDMTPKEYEAFEAALRNGDLVAQGVNGRYDFAAQNANGEAAIKSIGKYRTALAKHREKMQSNVKAFEKYMNLARKNGVSLEEKLIDAGMKGDSKALSAVQAYLKKNGVSIRKAFLEDTLASLQEKQKAATDGGSEKAGGPLSKEPIQEQQQIIKPSSYDDFTAADSLNDFTANEMAGVVPERRKVVGTLEALLGKRSEALAGEMANARELTPSIRQKLIDVLNQERNQRETQQLFARAGEKLNRSRADIESLDTETLMRLAYNVADKPMTNNIKQLIGQELANRGVLPPAISQGVNFDKEMLDIARSNQRSQNTRTQERAEWAYPLERPVEYQNTFLPEEFYQDQKGFRERNKGKDSLLKALESIKIKKFDEAEKTYDERREKEGKAQGRVFADPETQARLQALTGEAPGKILMPERENTISEALQQPLAEPVQQPAGVLRTAEDKVMENAYRSAVNRGDYERAAQIAQQSGRQDMADILRNVMPEKGVRERVPAKRYGTELIANMKANNIPIRYDLREALTADDPVAIKAAERKLHEAGVDADKIKFSFSDRHKRDRERMRQQEKEAGSFIPEGYEGRASGVVEGMAPHEVESIKNNTADLLKQGNSWKQIVKEYKVLYNRIKANRSTGMSEKDRIRYLRFLQGAINYVSDRGRNSEVFQPERSDGRGGLKGREGEILQSADGVRNDGRGLRGTDNRIDQDEHSEKGAFFAPENKPKYSMTGEEEQRQQARETPLTDRDVEEMVHQSIGQQIKMVPEDVKLRPKLRRIAEFGEKMGCKVRYFDGPAEVRGFHAQNTTYINRQAELPHTWVFWHESFHWMRNNNPSLYRDMLEYLRGKDGFSQKQIDAYRKATGRTDLSNDAAIEEMMADYMPDVSRRVGLMKMLGKENQSLAERLVAWIQDTMDRFHEFFKTPAEGLSPVQKRHMVEAFTRLVREMHNAEGKRIFLLFGPGKFKLFRNKQPVGSVLQSETPVAYSAGKQEPASWEEGVKPETLAKLKQTRRELQAYLEKHGETIKINTPERQALREKIAQELYGDGAKNKNREIYIVLGPPAAGKSSVAEPLAKGTGSLIIDSDMAKKRLPEFNNGKLAGAVHAESDHITTDFVLNRAMDNGDNIVLPVVGRTYKGLVRKVTQFKENGYKVNIVHVDLPIEKAVKRAIVRFEETGRFVDPAYVASIGYSTRENYDKIKNIEGVDSYEAYSNDVRRGEPPIHLENVRTVRGGRRQALYGNDGKAKAGKGTTESAEINRSDKQGGFSMSQNPDSEPKFSFRKDADKPVTREEIHTAINKLVTARTGKINQRGVLGKFDAQQNVVRTKFYGDFPTAAHEVGHYIDKELQIKGHTMELVQYAKKRFPNGEYKASELRAEGIAEFGRLILTKPALAEKEFPGYYKAYQEAIEKRPELGRPLEEIGRKMRQWYAQSPEARGSGSVVSAKDRSFKERARQAVDEFYMHWVDKLDPLRKMNAEIERVLEKKMEYQENIYERARMAESFARGRAQMLVMEKDPKLTIDTLNKALKTKLRHKVTLQNVFDGIAEEKMNKLYPDYLKRGNFENWHKAFSVYLVARRQMELQCQMPKYNGPLSKEDAAAIYRNAPQELAEAAEAYYKYNDNLLTIAEDAGLISKELHTILNEKYANYAPMLRDFSDEEAMDSFFGGKGGGGIGNVSSFLKKISEDGSDRNVLDPMEVTVKNTFVVLDRAERNKVAQLFVDLSKENALGKFAEELPGVKASDPKRSIFTVMVNGEKKAYQTLPEYYGAIAGSNQLSAGMVAGLFRSAAQMLRTGATISPDFILRNLFRDAVFAGISSKTGFIPIVDTIKGMRALKQNAELAMEFKAAGVPMSNFVGTNRRGASQTLDEMAGTTGWRKLTPVKVLHSLYEYAQDASELVESSSRMGEFMRARQQGKSIEEAGYLAKELTLDFGRSGVWGQKANQGIPFFNACIQGGDKMYRLLKEQPKRTLFALAKYIMLPSILLWALNHDEDWYKELPEDVKNGSWVWKAGDTIYRLPKPQEAGVLFGSSLERLMDQVNGENPKAVKEWAKYMKEIILPSASPALITPLLEWKTNYSFFTEKPVVGRKEQNLPEEMQYNLYTSELSKRLGSVLGLSPMKLDNTIKGYFGTAGSFVAQSMDHFFGKEHEMPEKKWSELAGIRGFTHTAYKRAKSVEEFYELHDAIMKEHNASGIKGHPAVAVQGMRRAAKRIADIQKDNRRITVSSAYTPEQKRKILDARNQQILAIAKRYRERYGKLVKE